ncbi:MAG: ribosome maturation factor RimM [bacterium]
MWVKIGKITKSHGIEGFVKLFLYSGKPERLVHYSLFQGTGRTGNARELIPEKVSLKAKTPMVKFQGTDSREAADLLAGLELSAKRSELPPLAEGEYYHSDLINLEVFDQQGTSWGVIKEIIETGANDVYSVIKEGREVLIPALKKVIVSVDLDRKRMTINPLKGLQD